MTSETAIQAAKALAAQPHVDGLKRDVDGQAMVDHCGPPLSATTTARSSAASKPGFTTIVTAPMRARHRASLGGWRRRR
jgi:hypothetical protein